MAIHSYTDISELVNHLKALTNELTALHADLYWLAMEKRDASANEAPALEVGVEALSELKGAVDDMRLLLWSYLETASQAEPKKVQDEMETQRLRRMARFLTLLRERLGRKRDDQPLSFIEKISAAMDEKFGEKVA